MPTAGSREGLEVVFTDHFSLTFLLWFGLVVVDLGGGVGAGLVFCWFYFVLC